MKFLPVLILFFILASCHFTWEKKGDLFVNQHLIESSIQEVQPARKIELAMQTRDGHDSVLIVRLTVDPKIPDDSLNNKQASRILSSFITLLPNLSTMSSCKIIFIKTTGSSFTTSSVSTAYVFPMTQHLSERVATYKDTTRASMGYLDTSWTYINRDLKLSLPLKPNWFYISEENDSIVYYPIGSDIRELPQYRTDSDRKVTFRTLNNLGAGNDYAVLQIRSDKPEALTSNGHENGSVVRVGLLITSFSSEDEYLRQVFELLSKKKMPQNQIHSFHFGNATFRGFKIELPMNGTKAYSIAAIKRMNRVSMMLSMKYFSEDEFKGIDRELSGLRVD